MRVTVLLFASYRDTVGARQLILELASGARVRGAAAVLEQRHPELSLKGALAAVNEHYVPPETGLEDGDTLAFLPPVSGGSEDHPGEHFIVTEVPLDLSQLTALATAPPYGAVATFLGTVRSPNAGQTVRYIDYQGYESMTTKQMAVVAQELRARYPLGRIVLAHRLGRLGPGEASIAIVISSAHRKEALAATQQAIDRCKELLPVWKYEVNEEGAQWVAGLSRATEPL